MLQLAPKSTLVAGHIALVVHFGRADFEHDKAMTILCYLRVTYKQVLVALGNFSWFCT